MKWSKLFTTKIWRNGSGTNNITEWIWMVLRANCWSSSICYQEWTTWTWFFFNNEILCGYLGRGKDSTNGSEESSRPFFIFFYFIFILHVLSFYHLYHRATTDDFIFFDNIITKKVIDTSFCLLHVYYNLLRLMLPS